MAGTKEIKRRIQSVKNTKKITKAMELVAASKMKRAVNATLASRLYAEYSRRVLESVSSNRENIKHPFFIAREEGKVLIVLVSSNRGLCGGYNSQIVRKALQALKELQSENIEIVTVGKKGDVAMRRINQTITAAFTDMPDVNISLSDITPLSELILKEFKNNTYKKVCVAYTDFASAIAQRPVVKQLLPVSRQAMEEVMEIGNTNSHLEVRPPSGGLTSDSTDYIFEGNITALLDMLAQKITRMQIYQMLLESNASEQSARMLAMKNATDASGEMIDDLTLVFNKARQANITREISEISAGMASVN